MLSITKCKKILNKNGIFYTDEEIVLIRQTLYKIAEVMTMSNKKKLSNKNLVIVLLNNI